MGIPQIFTLNDLKANLDGRIILPAEIPDFSFTTVPRLRINPTVLENLLRPQTVACLIPPPPLPLTLSRLVDKRADLFEHRSGGPVITSNSFARQEESAQKWRAMMTNAPIGTRQLDISAIELAWFMTTYRVVKGIWPNRNVHFRTSSKKDDGTITEIFINTYGKLSVR